MKSWVAFAFFLLLAILRLAPALAAGTGTVAALDVPDTWIHLWVFWRALAAFAGCDAGYLDSDLLSFPFILRAPTAVCDPLLSWLAVPLQFVGLSLPFVFNVLTVAGLTFTGFGVWLLASRLTGKKNAAIIAGVIAAMNPFLYRQLASGFTEFAWWGFIPMTLCLLLRWLDRPTPRLLALYLVSLLAMALMSIYATAYYVIIAAMLLLAVLAARHEQKQRRLRNILIAYAASAVCLAPLLLLWGAILAHSNFKEAPLGLAFETAPASFSEQLLMPEAELHPLPSPPPAEGSRLSSPPPPPPPLKPPKPAKAQQAPAWAFDHWRTLYASIDLGDFFSLTNTSAPRYLSNVFNPAALQVRSSLVPLREWLPVLLLAVAAVLGQKTWPARRFWVVAAVVFFFLALGPFPIWNGHVCTGITLPYAWLFKWAPGFSRLVFPARAALVSILALALLAAHGFAAALARIKPGLSENAATGVAVALSFGLLLLWPVLGDTRICLPQTRRPIPELYAGLAREPGRFALLELPVDSSASFRSYCQTLHGKPIFKGAVPDFMFQDYGDNELLRNPLVALLNEHSLDLIEAAEAQPEILRMAADKAALIGFKYAVFHDPPMLPPALIKRLVAAVESAIGPPALSGPGIRAWRLAEQ